MKTGHRYVIMPIFFSNSFLKREIIWENEPSQYHRFLDLVQFISLWGNLVDVRYFINSVHAFYIYLTLFMLVTVAQGKTDEISGLVIFQIIHGFSVIILYHSNFAFLVFSRWPRWMEFYGVLSTHRVQWKWDNLPMQSSYTFWCTDGNWKSLCFVSEIQEN